MHHFEYFSIMARHKVTLNEEMEKQIAALQSKENRGSFNNMAVELIRRGLKNTEYNDSFVLKGDTIMKIFNTRDIKGGRMKK